MCAHRYAGSSVAGFVTDTTLGTDATGTPEVVVTPVLPVLSFSPQAGLTFADTQPMQTLSSPRPLTITNTGAGPLQISSLTFTGSDPQDFAIVSNGCLGPIAGGASCVIGVSFAPQAQGPRSASLQIASNGPSSPASVPVSGTGGQLPQGPPGQNGAAGATGQTGAAGQTGAVGRTGPQGEAGKIELVVCKKVKKHARTVQQCTSKLVSGPVKFTVESNDLTATVSRAGDTYATGLAIPTGTGRWQLMLTPQLRRLRPGRYMLTLMSRHGDHGIVARRPITIT